jgi:hypothetical protein
VPIDGWELKAASPQAAQSNADQQVASDRMTELATVEVKRAKVFPAVLDLVSRPEETGELESVRRDRDVWSSQKRRPGLVASAPYPSASMSTSCLTRTRSALSSRTRCRFIPIRRHNPEDQHAHCPHGVGQEGRAADSEADSPRLVVHVKEQNLTGSMRSDPSRGAIGWYQESPFKGSTKRPAAAEMGERFRQLAIFELTAQELLVVRCADGRIMRRVDRFSPC